MTLQIVNTTTTLSDPTTAASNGAVSMQNIESELLQVIEQLVELEAAGSQTAGQGGVGFPNAGQGNPGFQNVGAPACGGTGFVPTGAVGGQSQPTCGNLSGNATANVPSLASDLDIDNTVHDAMNACDYVKNPYNGLHSWDIENAQSKLQDLQKVAGELQSRIAGAEAAGQPVSQQDKATLASLQQDIATCQADIGTQSQQQQPIGLTLAV